MAVKKPQSLRVTVYIAMATALAKDHTTRLNSDEITTLVNEIVPPGLWGFLIVGDVGECKIAAN